MKERSILFGAPMVRAILDGRKTQARFAVKPSRAWPTEFVGSSGDRDDPSCYGFEDPTTAQWWTLAPSSAVDSWQIPCPHGGIGDRLWVRETHAQVFEVDIPDGRPRGPLGTAGSPARPDWKSRYVYLADGPMPNVQWHHIGDSQPVRWTRSTHMSRSASRIILEITGVSVERLHAGDGETAHESRYLAEGIHRIHHGRGEYYYHPFTSDPNPGNWIDPFDAWRELWVSINGAESWNANPWVWTLEFRRITTEDGK